MPLKFTLLPTAEGALPKKTKAAADGLPARGSGSWAAEKHAYLLYYSKIFNSAMKAQWQSRIYIEFFAGPGRCIIGDTTEEMDGSAIKILDCDFTRFIFFEISIQIAEALRDRLQNHPKKDLIEIWVGDCNEAIEHVMIPNTALSLAFIDPTMIGHCPFSLIEKTRKKSPRIDLLVNIPIGTDIKRNYTVYPKQQGPNAHLTRYLNGEEWRKIPTHDPKIFGRKVIELFEAGLRSLNWGYVGDIQRIVRDDKLPLYYLFFASAHSAGQKFWNETLKYLNEPELPL